MTKDDMHQESSPTRMRTFDFLRGLAIIGVIVVHTSQIFPSQIILIDSAASLGRFGVQLFYFISALTMCHMWKIREGEKSPVKNFYIRRFFRIAPLFWIAIPLYISINGLGKSYWAPEGVNILQIFLTATFLHGFWPNTINSVVPGGWSIAVEMSFYVIFPFLVLNIKKRDVYLQLAIITWIFNVLIFRDCALDFLGNHYNTNSTSIVNEFLHLNFINQAPIFLLGCYIHSILNNQPGKTEIFLLAAWILLAASLKYFCRTEGFGFLAAYMAIGIFVYACIKANLKFKSIEKIGKSSYAIYLVHFLVLHYLHEVTPLKTGPLALLIGIGLTTLISYFLAFIIFKVIESNVQNFVDAVTTPKPNRVML